MPFDLVLAADGSAEPPFRFYSTVDGLTQSEATDIDQDRAGHLWFTTRRGLNRYDGKEFTHYTIADGLRINDLTSLVIDSENKVWVGDARGGIAVVESSRISHVIEPYNDASTPILDMAVIDGRIFALAKGLGILEVVASENEYRLDLLDDEAIDARAMSVSDGNIWIVAKSGLYQFAPAAGMEPRHVAEGIVLAHTASDGTLWIADSNNQIGIWSNDALNIRAVVDTADELISLVTADDNTVWIATTNELVKLDGSLATPAEAEKTIERFQASYDVTSLYVDREDALWLLSESRLIRFLGSRFRHFELKTGADSQIVWSISEDNRGRMWFGTQTNLLVRETDESLLTIGPDNGVPRGPVRDVVFGANEEMWAGIRGHGLFRVDTETLQGALIPGTEGLEILDVDLANDGAVWFSTLTSGVFRYAPENGSVTVYHPPVAASVDHPVATSVYTLDAWEDGSIWYAADDIGLVHLIPAGSDTYTQEVFESPGVLENHLFNHLRVLGDDQLWLATEEGGLYTFESGTFSKRASEAAWADQTVYLVELLPNGSIVVGGEQGLYQLAAESQAVSHYNQLSGFLGVETNVHATFTDSQGFLWIGTVQGATRMDSTLPVPIPRKPTPQIINMETVLDRIPLVNNGVVDPRQQGVHVEFAAVSLLNPRGIQYSYKLIGMSEDWSPATTIRSVNFSRLPPGPFEIIVRAKYPGGDWSQEYASRTFTVQPFFWQEQWFKLSTVAALLLLLGISTRYRTRRIARQNEALRSQVEERTRSIEEAKQHLLISNDKLSQEIEERQKSEKARKEIEARFRLAFENAPIGMGLLDDRGYLFDANPVLRNMLWGEAEPPVQFRLADLLSEDERSHFYSRYQQLISGEIDNCEEKFSCLGPGGTDLRVLINLSAVRSDGDKLLYVVLQMQDITESRRLTKQLEYQASYDDLTGLLNRRSFERELSLICDAEETGNTLSYLMYMDLDQFKVVNDTSGHAAGDKLLKIVGDVLVGIVRADDVVCRLGGDEFGIILRNCPTTVAKRIAETIRENIENLRFPWGSEVYRIGMSIGGLPIDPSTGNASELQQLADAACYAAKEAGRNRVHMVDGEKDTALQRRGQVRWVQRLREAMDNNRFVLYGQIIKPVDERSTRPERLEVLLRLRDPATRRLIPPGAFLPAAERYGLSIEVDQWVVRNLLDMLFVHQTVATEYRKYWVNLSGTSIGDKRFARFLIDAIKESPLPRGTVNFEITETAVIRSVNDAGNMMAQLREMGCEFALDDFGSGLSSFAYLKNMPVDYLKIDGNFVRDITQDVTDRAMVGSITEIGHVMGIYTIAEFAETIEVVHMLEELDVDYAQGFGIERPYPLAKCMSQLGKRPKTTGPLQTQLIA